MHTLFRTLGILLIVACIPVWAATAPGAPTIGTATPGNARATVNFAESSSDGGSAITSYRTTSSPTSATKSCAAPCTSITVTGLTNGTTYTFRVTAVNAIGTSAASAASNSLIPATVPGAPTIGIATAGNTQATVNFTAPASNGGSAITSYAAISIPENLTGSCTAPCTSITVPGLTNGTAYTFTVKATNAMGTGAASAASNSVIPVATVSSAPTIGNATAGNAQATVSFTESASDGGSAITSYRATSTPGSIIGTCVVPCTSITVPGLVNGTAYTFKVRAVNAIGTSAASAASNSVTPATVPGAPTIGTATAGNTQATVTFTAPISTGGSAITAYTTTSTPGNLSGSCPAPCTSITVPGLTNGTAYTFTVTAANAAGEGVPSAASNSVTPANPSPTVSLTAPANNSTLVGSTLIAPVALVNTGTTPYRVAINSIKNKIYVANLNSNNVTVIDGATNSTATVNTGTSPFQIAVNSVTNRIYVANYDSSTVTVINGATNATSTVSVGIYPQAIEVNSVTNKIYVANYGSNNVTVIDGATNSTTTIAMGSSPSTLAINSTTNKIYVATGNTVTVINGATNSKTTVAVGMNPQFMAVNSATNKIYLTDINSNNVMVINGVNNSTTTIAGISKAYAIAVNSNTNKIYVGNHYTANGITVIDGATNNTTQIAGSPWPYAIAVNPVTNKIYVANNGSYNNIVTTNVTVIDGVTDSATEVVAGTNISYGIAVNPTTNKTYVANYNSNSVTVINDGTITLSAQASDPNGSISKVEFYNGETLLGTSTNAPYTYCWSNVAAGSYSLTAKAYDNQDAITTSAAVAITIVAAIPGVPTNVGAVGGSTQATVTFAAPLSDGGSPITGYTVTSLPAGGVDSNAGTTGLSHVITGLANGATYTFTVVATNAVGAGQASAASNSVTPATTAPGAPTIDTATAGNTVASVSFIAPSSDGGSAITGYIVTSNPGNITRTCAASPCTVTGLTNGTTYKFWVRATNAVGTSVASAISNTVTPAAVPGAPTISSAIAGNAQATLTITAPASNGGSAITSYTVTSNLGGVTTCTASPCIITGLGNGTSYTFTATANNVMGSSAASLASNSVTPATVPGMPTIETVMPGNAQATLTITAPMSDGGSPITGYSATSNPGGISGTCAASPCIVTGLTNGTAYTFTVTATNAMGSSAASAATISVTPATIPDAPTIGTATGGNARATVAFTTSASNGGATITGYTATSNPGGITSTCAASPCTVTGLTNGTAYTFTVTAANAVGTSAASSPSNRVIAAPPLTVYYIHTDHLDTPREITDTQGNKVWEWDNSDPFGNNPPNENPSNLGTFVYNQRFPGQYFDKETNTHYNYFRDYDPASGRYIEFDPIGLAGGINGYGYVGGNPLSFKDPFGLEVTRWARPADLGPGGVVGVFVDHHWLKTDAQESGMGPMTGEVPAQNGESSLPGVPVQTVDHSSPSQSRAPNAKQIPIPFPVDEQCVNNFIRIGRMLGKFGVGNNCQTLADEVLNTCRIDPALGRPKRWMSGIIKK